jgi:hypothetical protein
MGAGRSLASTVQMRTGRGLAVYSNFLKTGSNLLKAGRFACDRAFKLGGTGGKHPTTRSPRCANMAALSVMP